MIKIRFYCSRFDSPRERRCQVLPIEDDQVYFEGDDLLYLVEERWVRYYPEDGIEIWDVILGVADEA